MLTNQKKSTSLLLCIIFSFCIEIFQLVQLDCLVAIRKTTLGHYVLGQGFLIADLFYLTLGSIIAYGIDNKILPIKTQNLN